MHLSVVVHFSFLGSPLFPLNAGGSLFLKLLNASEVPRLAFLMKAVLAELLNGMTGITLAGGLEIHQILKH